MSLLKTCLAVGFLLVVYGITTRKDDQDSTEDIRIPDPQIPHLYLDSTYLQRFEEVLVIGDVHGCYDELIQLLESADVFTERTLKIFAGDMLRKGFKNKEVLNFLTETKSVLAVRGNNDDKVLREYIKAMNPSYEIEFNETWIRNLSPEDIRYLTELPYTISLIPLKAIIVHAGLLPGISLEDNTPNDMTNMRNIITCHDGRVAATAETCEGDPWASKWSGPDHVYFGHDSKRMLQTYPFATGLDTGCVYGKWLTGLFISGPRKGNFVEVKAMNEYCQQKDANDCSLQSENFDLKKDG